LTVSPSHLDREWRSSGQEACPSGLRHSRDGKDDQRPTQGRPPRRLARRRYCVRNHPSGIAFAHDCAKRNEPAVSPFPEIVRLVKQ
jgi:hypothetical protein